MTQRVIPAMPLFDGYDDLLILDRLLCPRIAQRDVHLAEASSQTRSMLALFSEKGLSFSLSFGNRKALKDVLKPNCC